MLFDSSNGFTVPNITERNQRNKYSDIVGTIPGRENLASASAALRCYIGSILLSNTRAVGFVGRKDIWVLVPAL